VLGVEKTPLPETQEDCENAGGSWEQLGMIGMGCNMPTTDAGQPCDDIQQCQGFCLATDPNMVQTDRRVTNRQIMSTSSASINRVKSSTGPAQAGYRLLAAA
jgi:hypothetical protein